MDDANSGGHKYITIKELSATSRFSVTQLRRLAKDGKIPFFQLGGVGGKLLFPSNAVELAATQISNDPGEKSSKPLPGRGPGWMQTKSNNKER